MDISSTILGKRSNDAHDIDLHKSQKKQHIDTLTTVLGKRSNAAHDIDIDTHESNKRQYVKNRTITEHDVARLHYIIIGMDMDEFREYIGANFDYETFKEGVYMSRCGYIYWINFGKQLGKYYITVNFESNLVSKCEWIKNV